MTTASALTLYILGSLADILGTTAFYKVGLTEGGLWRGVYRKFTLPLASLLNFIATLLFGGLLYGLARHFTITEPLVALSVIGATRLFLGLVWALEVYKHRH